MQLVDRDVRHAEQPRELGRQPGLARAHHTADDHPLLRQGIKQLIDMEDDMSVAGEASNAADGIRLATELEPDLILMDLNMPEMDGLTLLSKLNELSPLIKSVIVSAYGDMENIRTAMNRGAFDFITKPINFEDLTLTMEKTLKHAKLLKETLTAKLVSGDSSSLTFHDFKI